MSELKLGLFDLPSFGKLLEAPTRARKNRTPSIWRPGNVAEGGAGSAPQNDSSQARLSMLRAVARKHPEVMVKISGTNTGSGALRAHLSYLQRRADGDIEDEHGARFEAEAHSVGKILKQWGVAIDEGDENDRQDARLIEQGGPPVARKTIAIHIVLSMPKGTNAEAVCRAARAFGQEELQNHQHVMVLHTDKAHPHVHVVVNNIGNDLRRLSRSRDDMQRWREVFAHHLREQGIDAAATPRKARGVLKKSEKPELWQAKRRMAGERREGQASRKALRNLRSVVERAENELRGVVPHDITPAEARARANRADLEQGMRDAIDKLSQQGGEGSGVARELTAFLRDMPLPETQLDEVKRQLQTARGQAREIHNLGGEAWRGIVQAPSVRGRIR